MSQQILTLEHPCEHLCTGLATRCTVKKAAPKTRSQASDTSATGAAADVNRGQPPVGSESDGDSPPYGPSGPRQNSSQNRHTRTRRTASTESVSQDNIPVTTSADPRRKIRWTNDMNEFIVKQYFRVMKDRNNTSGYAEILRACFTQNYPMFSYVTTQNMVDRKNYIFNTRRARRPLSQAIIDQTELEIEREYRENTENETIEEETPEANNSIKAQNNRLIQHTNITFNSQ